MWIFIYGQLLNVSGFFCLDFILEAVAGTAEATKV